MLATREPTVAQVRTSGAYLTDGEQLFRVIDLAGAGRVWLENCRFPDLPPEAWDVSRVRAECRLVRPLA